MTYDITGLIIRIVFKVIIICRDGTGGLNKRNTNIHILLTGIFFCVATTAQSVPRRAIDVIPPWFIALNAYSKNQNAKTKYF